MIGATKGMVGFARYARAVLAVLIASGVVYWFTNISIISSALLGAVVLLVVIVECGPAARRMRRERETLRMSAGPTPPKASDTDGRWALIDGELRKGHTVQAIAIVRYAWDLELEEARRLISERDRTLKDTEEHDEGLT
jgi:hypothetical protein